MPNRIIKESICTSETIEKLTAFEETFFYRLTVNCDDYGRMDARPAILKAKLFPLKDRLTLKDIQGALNKLADIGCVRLYTVEQKPYLYFPSWSVHQRVRNSREKYPSPDENSLRRVAASCGENLPESNPIQSESIYAASPQKFTPPTVDEVKAYCTERRNKVDAEKWHDFYTAKNWMIGKNKMKDWKAAVRTWENTEKQKSSRDLTGYKPG